MKHGSNTDFIIGVSFAFIRGLLLGCGHSRVAHLPVAQRANTMS
jgi:hypothetical protein